MNVAKAIKNPAPNIKAPLKVTVLGIGTRKTLQDRQGKNVSMWTAAVADKTAAVKINLYHADQATKFNKPGQTLLIKYYSSKGTHLTSNADTKFFKTTHLDIPDDIRQAGLELIHPPEAPMVSIENAKASPIKTKVSVAGKVIQANAVRQVSTAKSPQKIPIQDIELKDQSGQIRCSLWRDAADTGITPGDYLQITNVYVSSYQNESSLNTTDMTEIKRIEPPQHQVMNATIIALDDNETNDDICMLSNDEDADEYHTSLQAITNHLHETRHVDVQTLNDVNEFLPLTLSFSLDDSNNVINFL